MIELKQTATFQRWSTRLKDKRTRALIASRLDRLAFGLTGDAKPVGQGVSELRIDHGPGFRIYFQRRGGTIIVLLWRRQEHPGHGHRDGQAPVEGMERRQWLRD